jgi:hypothetical protein
LKPYLPYLFLLLLVASCKPGTDEVPSYVHIPAMSVLVTDPLQGTTSQKITDVWLYADDEILGVYPLPVTIPVLKTGTTKLTFSPGILANGISTTRVQYPFYTDTIMFVDLVAGQTDTITPYVTYRSATQFLLNEDFENGNEFSNVERVTNASSVFEGNTSGRILVDTTRYVRMVTNTKFQVNQDDGVIVFVELDYKSTHVMKAGIIGSSTTQGTFVISKVFIAPQDDWNKIYLNFTPEINNTLAYEFQFFLEVNEQSTTDDINNYIDNVKILLDE